MRGKVNLSSVLRGASLRPLRRNRVNKFPQVRYYASRKNKFVEITHAPVNGISTKVTKPVSGKVEARQIAKELNGVAWNF